MGKKERKNPTLDLHGVKHADVENTVDRFIYNHREYSGWAMIITGKSYRMKTLVLAVLDRYSFEKIQSNDIFNTGYIKVYL